MPKPRHTAAGATTRKHHAYFNRRRFGRLLLVYLTITTWENISAERILIVNQPVAPSHVRLLHTLAVELKQAGHELTVLRFPLTDQVAQVATPANITSLSFRTPGPLVSSAVNAYVEHWAWLDKADVTTVAGMVIEHAVNNFTDLPHLVARWLGIAKLLVDPCVQFESDAALRDVLQRGNFSLAIMDPIAHACGWIILNNMQLPYVAVNNFAEFYGLDLAAGVPVPMSYVPAGLDARTDKMSFFARLVNAPMHLVLDVVHDYIFVPTAMALTATPMVSGNRRWLSPSLTLVNGQRYFDDLPRPVANTLHTFNKVKLAGEQEQPLDERIKSFVEHAPSQGTVILSMSTTTSTAGMPEETQRHFANAFIQLRHYRFIWRLAGPSVCDSGRPALDCGNIMTLPWIPQTRLLAHNGTRLLITHGGINSVVESLTYGVPTLVVPMFGDQFPNGARLQTHGTGRLLLKHRLADELHHTLEHMLTDDKYTRAARRRAAMVNDQERLYGMRDVSMHWIHKALRHCTGQRDNCRTLLRPKAHDLASAVYFSIDAMAAIAAFALAALLLLR